MEGKLRIVDVVDVDKDLIAVLATKLLFLILVSLLATKVADLRT